MLINKSYMYSLVHIDGSLLTVIIYMNAFNLLYNWSERW